jgi:glycerol-3-phosphate acyltransferase PlsY
MLSLTVWIVISYLIGSFPSGFLVAKLNGINITAIGSGNIGATNVARTIGSKMGIIVLLADVLKGLLPFLLALIFNYDLPLICAFTVVAGHCFSLPKLKGGKGVATALGTIIGVSPIFATIAVITFAIAFYLSKTVSISSIVATWIVPGLFVVTGYSSESILIFLAIALLVTYRHKDNIDRITKGIEPKFISKK